MNTRKIVLICVPLLVFFVAVYSFQSYRHSFQTITLASNESNSGFKVTLYGALDTSESNAYDKNVVALNASTPGTYRVKKSTYVYVVSGQNSDYQPATQRVTIGADPVRLSIPSLDYTDQKLASLLAAEEPQASAAIQARYSYQLQTYTIQSGRLYKKGQWYAAKLVPNDPDANDTLRIVLKKTGTGWRVVTDPPEIVIGQPVYPDIPLDILTDLNNFR